MRNIISKNIDSRRQRIGEMSYTKRFGNFTVYVNQLTNNVNKECRDIRDLIYVSIIVHELIFVTVYRPGRLSTEVNVLLNKEIKSKVKITMLSIAKIFNLSRINWNFFPC